MEERRRIEDIDSSYETTLQRQLHKIYLDQKKRREAQEKRKRFIRRWGFLISCCL
jgi:hypothetical protein